VSDLKRRPDIFNDLNPFFTTAKKS